VTGRVRVRSGVASESDRGSSLIEALGATVVLLIVMAGLLDMDAIATRITENYGHLAARTAEYAQDKMEQLMALSWGDSTSDTTVFPATSAGGTGLAVGGSSNVSAPVAGYVDYLDQNGQLLTASGVTPPATWYYKRVWQITLPSTNLKQITVSVTVVRGYEHAQPAVSTMALLKSFPF
jgi:hypothetical protein